LAASDSPREEQLAPGTVVAGRYRVGERLGAGAIGAVYYAEHITVERPVAIKVLAPQWMSHREMVERFRSEAKAASAAGHPNIIEVFDAGDLESGLPYLVMEYLPGRELYELIREANGMAPRRAARYGRAVARAIAAAHERGIVHRDLKAENVMVVERDGSETIKVLDFGVAHVGAGGERRTTPGMVIGTPEYMAPEQVRGKPATPAIDVYAMGVLLHEMLTGQPPFVAAEPIDVLAMKTAGPAPSIADTRPDVPGPMATIVDRCLAMDPQARPSAHEVARALDEIAEGQAGRDDDDEPTAIRWGWLVALAAVAAAVTAFALLRMRGTPVDPEPPLVVFAPSDATDEPVAVADLPVPSGSSSDGGSTSATDTGGSGSDGAGPDVADDSPERPTSTGATPRKRDPLPPPPEDPPPPLEPDPPAASSAKCGLTRTRALEARKHQDWDGVLRYTANAGCYDSKLERQRLRVLAYLQLGDYDRCISAGRSSGDSEIARSVSLCEKKKAR
jgi:serine/threonine-protein kinase